LVNEKAVASYKALQNKYAPVSANDFLYVIHNLHMQTNHAMMTGSSSYAVRSAKQTAESIPKEYLVMEGAMGNYLQYIYMTPVIVDVRYGNWNNLLTMPQPAAGMIYANLLYHFGRGMALAHQNKLSDAKTELGLLQTLVKDSTLALPFSPFSPAIDGAIIAENILIGTIALKERKFSDAIAAFEEAVVTEENMVYNEPRDWMLNPKHYMGNALIKAKRTKEAKEILIKDLQNNNENGWALFGLWQAFTMEKKTAEANKLLTRFRKAFDKADIKLYGPVF
jgi:tetratricopeptide (TPR) repeat protein